MKRSIEVLLAAFVTGFVAFQLGTCAAPAPETDAREYALETERILRRNRNALAERQDATDTSTKAVIRQDAKVLAERDSLKAVLAYADSVLRDSAATITTLRVTLGVTIARARSFEASSAVYQDSVRVLIAAHALEREATRVALASADTAVAAQKRRAEAERRKGWRRFTQGAFVGGIVALLAAVVL